MDIRMAASPTGDEYRISQRKKGKYRMCDIFIFFVLKSRKKEGVTAWNRGGEEQEMKCGKSFC